jgi:hypothetical protein
MSKNFNINNDETDDVKQEVTQTKAETKTQTKTETKTQTQSSNKAKPKTQTKTQDKAQSKTTTKSEVKKPAESKVVNTNTNTNTNTSSSKGKSTKEKTAELKQEVKVEKTMTGSWHSSEQGAFLTMDEFGYRIDFSNVHASKPITGNYRIENNLIIFSSDGSECKGEDGTYRINFFKKNISLTCKSDDCTNRRNILEADWEWLEY